MTENVSIRFVFDSKFGQYSDALILPADHTYTEEELDAMKLERFNNWLAIFDQAAADSPAPDTIDVTPTDVTMDPITESVDPAA